MRRYQVSSADFKQDKFQYKDVGTEMERFLRVEEKL
jgi:hypothetical protein